MLSVENNRVCHDEAALGYDEFQDPNYPKITLPEDSPKEWTYVMRRSMQEVVRGLYLGPYSAATKSKLSALMDCHITHIVCVRQNIEAQFIKPNFPDKFKYLVLDIADSPTENIIQHFKTVKMFIDEAMDNGTSVLIHGNAGISRSAALVIAYLMETYGLSWKKAHCILQHRRFCINPNEGFLIQLKEYEPIYKAQEHWRYSQLPVPHGIKRAFDKDDDKPEPMDS